MIATTCNRQSQDVSTTDSSDFDDCRFEAISKNDFVMEVLYDGRYVNELVPSPEKVAAKLRFDVNEEILDEIRQSELPKLMGDACDEAALAIARGQITAGFTRPPSMDVAISGTVVIAAVVVIGIVTVSTSCSLPGMTDVDDGSPDADEKL